MSKWSEFQQKIDFKFKEAIRNIKYILENIFKLYSNPITILFIRARFENISSELKKFMFEHPTHYNIIQFKKQRWYITEGWYNDSSFNSPMHLAIPIIVDMV
jgi:hypothetical protein